ncbi:MFS transporter [Bradyrhizobium manausense]|uniref:MFS transporter n=1 Tax=Bradyrhizobium TaxID=374 RepID=UPI001BA975E2|nr:MULTISPECIES: MFS transporter [Bradyrhizobium]MBR0828872.1 MFS transporter [Bradyrhizobium manausense]UVO28119.1 MFS transporter [Bradyrhizobium arachidis]
MTSRSRSPRLWPLLALNFFMADMQSGIGPFVGVFLQAHGWASGMIGTAMTIGNVAGMLITTPIGGFIDASRNKRMWVVIPGICVVAASAIILISQNFWAATASQVAQSLASAAIVPAVTGITLGMVKQKGFNQQNGRNQAFNHAGNMVGAALSGYLGWAYGYVAVFVLAAAFGAIAIACVLMVPPRAIDDRVARGSKEDDSKAPPDAMRMLLKHKPLLVLALALAIFHLGNAAIVPLYGLAAVADEQANGPSFVATTVVIAQGVMVVTSLIAMKVASKRNYWPVILASFMFLPIRGVLAFFLTGWWGVVPVQVLDGIGTGLQTVAVPGMVASSLNGTGRINLGQGAVITVQGVGASLSPALGGWIAEWIGYGPTFLLLGGFGIASMALWFAFGAAVKKY